jgi:putative metallohydrolase (TIGR04338 family)
MEIYMKAHGNVGRKRDSQRQKVYDAEDAVWPKRETMSLGECKALVRRVWASQRARESWPKAWVMERPQAKPKHHGRATGGLFYIHLPRWAQTPHVVLHELAHTISRRQFGFEPPAHGWEFCSVYLRLVLLFMGREAHDKLKASFKAKRVKFTAPRKVRQLSPEDKAALVARLKAGLRYKANVMSMAD